MNQNKKITTSTAEIPPLSEELESEILIRLPTKTLFTCNCVCKRWQSLISDSSFVQRRNSHPVLISGFFFCEDHPCVQMEPKVNFFENDPNDTLMDTSLSFLHQSVVPVASHNGLLLCAERPDIGFFSVLDPFRYILCNPYTKQFVALPVPNRDHTLKNVILHSYDKQPVDFKVICLTTENRNNVLDLAIYSSETGEWKESLIFHHLGLLRPASPVGLSDGSFYFWNTNIWHTDIKHLCVCNLEEERVGIVDLPIVPSSNSGIRLLGVSADCLHYSESNETHFRVWVLINGEEWSLKHDVMFESFIDDLQSTLDSDSMFYPLAFHPLNDQIVLVEMTHGRKVAIYHMDEEKIVVIDDIGRSIYFPVIPYFSPAWPPSIRKN